MTTETSLNEGEVRAAPPGIFVLFGATGDLAARKIAPALYNLALSGLLDEHFVILAVGRRQKTDDEARAEALESIEKFSRSQPIDKTLWQNLAGRWYYQTVDNSSAEDFARLKLRLDELDQRHGSQGARLFYLAIPPDQFPAVIGQLSGSGLNQSRKGRASLVVEKPFGSDLDSARRLNELLLSAFQESQIYRIDHYMGKETTQNILVFRFANAIFEHLFDRRMVERVEITTAETVGMEGRRGEYYEKAGALRDMIQNHMLQLMALTAMESPGCVLCADIRDAKAKLLQAIAPLTPQEVARWTVRGQYGGQDEHLAYRQEAKVAPDSNIETYAAVRLFIDNKRWQGVPFYLRTGKHLATKTSQIVVVFKREPARLLESIGCEVRSANRLCIRISPNEGISMTFDAKLPGVRMLLRPVHMDFRYGSSFESASPEAYEQLLLDSACGDQTLFIRNDEVESCWRVVDSIRQAWDMYGQPPLESYRPSTWGPENADRIFGDPYTHWQNF